MVIIRFYATGILIKHRNVALFEFVATTLILVFIPVYIYFSYILYLNTLHFKARFTAYSIQEMAIYRKLHTDRKKIKDTCMSGQVKGQ